MSAGGEQILRRGPAKAATVLILPPLFEEANRLRRTLLLTMRALADAGIASLLPDLPGQNESLVATDAATLSLWREEAAALAVREEMALVAAFRGSCLIDDQIAAPHWRCAPVSGHNLLKAMLRSRIASDSENGVRSDSAQLLAQAQSAPLSLAGNLLSPKMIAELSEAEPRAVTPLRTVKIGTSGENMIAGTPLWLRAEPGEDADMARAMATDIADWMQQCGTI